MFLKQCGNKRNACTGKEAERTKDFTDVEMTPTRTKKTIDEKAAWLWHYRLRCLRAGREAAILSWQLYR